ncbi:hypothetical protein ACF1BU_38730 [Streptomyces sp. NPDC014724]|uniref:hypothetical protein n=1 Tax=unclassified Streptomyces TaxID=2593676 RepID=UPI0037018E04
MIATTPVARWSWGDPGHATDLVQEAVRRLSLALGVLDRHRLGTPHGGTVTAVVPEPGRQNFVLRADLPVDDAIVSEIKRRIADGKVGGVELSTSCDGLVETGDGSEAVEGLFRLAVDVSESFFHVELTTFSDAWMPFDLRGREQRDVFTRNRPRLAEALADISEALDLEIDPEDPTWFGIPTATGVENHFEDSAGSPSDVWGRFEIPHRNGIFSQTPRFTAAYRRDASGRVQYLPVHRGHDVLGYLWASDTENAASFEPCDAADVDGYQAGLIWLNRLQAAYDRGLPPSAALTELRNAPPDPVAGQAAGTAPVEADSFGALRELAGS